MSRAGGLGPLLVVVGGVVLIGGIAVDWVSLVETRTVGGVGVEETVTTSGAEYAGTGLVLGVAAALAGGLQAVLRGPARRWLGSVLILLAVVTSVVIVFGLLVAMGEPGTVTAAPGVALLGAIAVGAGGWMGRVPRQVLGPRYTVDEDVDEGEWDAAAVEEDEDAPGQDG